MWLETNYVNFITPWKPVPNNKFNRFQIWDRWNDM